MALSSGALGNPDYSCEFLLNVEGVDIRVQLRTLPAMALVHAGGHDIGPRDELFVDFLREELEKWLDTFPLSKTGDQS